MALFGPNPHFVQALVLSLFSDREGCIAFKILGVVRKGDEGQSVFDADVQHYLVFVDSSLHNSLPKEIVERLSERNGVFVDLEVDKISPVDCCPSLRCYEYRSDPNRQYPGVLYLEKLSH